MTLVRNIVIALSGIVAGGIVLASLVLFVATLALIVAAVVAHII